jgi:hypothetical protein
MKKFKEKKIVDILNQELKEHLLKHCVGIKNSISMDSIAFIFNTNTRQIRAEIEELRRNNPFGESYLVSSDLGYWISDDKEEIEKFLHRFLGVAYSMLKTAKPAIKLLNHKKQEEFATLFSVVSETDLQEKYKHAILPSGDKIEKK